MTRIIKLTKVEVTAAGRAEKFEDVYVAPNAIIRMMRMKWRGDIDCTELWLTPTARHVFYVKETPEEIMQKIRFPGPGEI